MTTVKFEQSPDHEYPKIELDMANFVDNLSKEHTCQQVEVRDDGVGINQKVIDCKIEACTDLGEISSNCGREFKQEEKVSIQILLHFIVKDCGKPLHMFM